MGHLSKSERVEASKAILPSNEYSKTMLVDSCDGLSENNSEKSDNNNNSGKNIETVGPAEYREVRSSGKTQLNVYENWKGDNVFGIQFKAPLKWGKIIQIGLIHILFIYAFIDFFYEYKDLKMMTIFWAFFTGGMCGFGITGGAHRFWTHRSFKAKLPLRIILITCFSMAGQNTMFDWVRDHRVHHKFSETDADPHNAHRGFFFAHVGWLMMYKHPEVLRRGNKIDMSDVLDDPVIQFHQKYFLWMKLFICFILPTAIPMYFWGETFYYAFMSQCVLRYVCGLNFTWSVNSAAHLWGTRPYDRRISPSENLWVSILAMGEGWHNYHHVFPWDYKAAEFGKYSVNVTAFWLDMFAKIGWAYDLKQPSKDLVKRTIEKCGDGSHPEFGHHLSEVPMPKDDENYDENSNFWDKKE